MLLDLRLLQCAARSLMQHHSPRAPQSELCQQRQCWDSVFPPLPSCVLYYISFERLPRQRGAQQAKVSVLFRASTEFGFCWSSEFEVPKPCQTLGSQQISFTIFYRCDPYTFSNTMHRKYLRYPTSMVQGHPLGRTFEVKVRSCF